MAERSIIKYKDNSHILLNTSKEVSMKIVESMGSSFKKATHIDNFGAITVISLSKEIKEPK